MSTSLPSLSSDSDEAEHAAGPSLQDVLDVLQRHAGASTQSLQNMRSAIRSLGRVLDREPRFIPIAAPALRRHLAGASPGAVGLSASRWRNVRSDVVRAIRLSGLEQDLSTSRIGPSPAWEVLISAQLRQPNLWVLRGFARYCSSQELEPAEVGDATVRAYRDHLDLTRLSRSPDRTRDEVIRFWNRHLAGKGRTGLVPLTPARRSRAYTLRWPDLPRSLYEDSQAYHEASCNPDPLDPDARPAVRESTTYARDRLIRRIATAEVKQGVAAGELENLAALFQPDRFELALRFFLARNDGKPNVQTRDAAQLALTIARHWVKAPQAQIDRLRLFARRCHVERRGLTEKNRDRLRQFTDDAVLGRFLSLPRMMAGELDRRPRSPRTALQMQSAVAIMLLIIAPIRIGNLVRLDRHRHFTWGFHDGSRQLHLLIPAAEVKNDVDLEFPVPPVFAALLDRYMTTCQPLLCCDRGSSCLFPGRGRSHKAENSLRRQITATIRREIGIAINPHLFRHLLAYVYLSRHPGHYEDVRRLLGHRRLSTTIQAYTGLDTIAAARRYTEIVLNAANDDDRLRSGRKRRA